MEAETSRLNVMIRLLRPVLVFALAVTLLAGMAGLGCSKKGSDNVISINIQGAKNVGSVYIQLSYDPGVFKVTEVSPGEVGKNGMLVANFSQPGSVVIGLVDSKGISGSGTLVLLDFEVIDKKGNSVISLDSVELHDATSLVDIRSRTTDGNFNAGKAAITPPVVSCSN